MDRNLQADIAAVSSIDAIPAILDVVCRTTGMGFAAVARVTPERWVACTVLDKIQFGLKQGGELKVETTICDEIRQSGQAVIIDHVSEDKTYRKHPTPGMYGFESYISMPIMLRDGTFFGTLCAIDPSPARVNTPEVIGMFKLFAELIAFHLDAKEQLTLSEARLTEERQGAVLRDQFIAVLGHDLRNPLSAITTGTMLLERTPLNERASTLTALIKESAARMQGLIEDILDFARGKLGGGISLTQDADERLEPVLTQVISELSHSWPASKIVTDVNLATPVYCDRNRIGQLFSNLLGNALTHGKTDHPVKIRAISNDKVFLLAVSNASEQIPAAAMERLFNPFCRGEVRPKQQGLGLGLYIAAEIARAHGGKIDVSSSPGEVVFTFSMPLPAGLQKPLRHEPERMPRKEMA